MAQLAETLRRPTVVHAGCLASIGLANKPIGGQLEPRCRYAGCRRWALAQKGSAYLLEARHVRAHRSEEVMAALEPAERRRARANDLADRAAKKALQLHPAASDGVQRILTVTLDIWLLVLRRHRQS